MKIKIILALLIFTISNLNAQKYLSENGYINFFSETPVEDIKADNFDVTSAIDSETGEIVFKVPIKSFEFKKKLMQEHFNENYLESDKFPYATFKGKIANADEINFSNVGRYKAIVEGDLTIHGITRKVKEEGQIDVGNGEIFAKANFYVATADYDIKIPRLVRKKIAETIMISVDVKYRPTE
jgi:polyisoprenoid-binding protein YceI